MRQQVTIDYVMEVSDGGCFHRVGDMYREAELLAVRGEIRAAIETAQDIRVKEYGNMFRIIQTTRTVSQLTSFKEFESR